MPLDHSNATATFSITGLALGCYNLETSNYEVGFIRAPRHFLTIKVSTQLSNGKFASISFDLDKSHRIFLETEGGINPQAPFFKPTAKFDRKALGQDPEDFQWIVDIETDLNGGRQVTLIPPQLPVTEMYISKPVLYADPEGFVLGNVNVVDVANPDQAELFGGLCEVIKGDITCEEGGAVILRFEGPLGFTIRLPRIAGVTHTIVMDNTCPPQATIGPPAESSSDFTAYYSLVESTAGKRFDFMPVEQDVDIAGSTCNGSTLGISGHLYPLP